MKRYITILILLTSLLSYAKEKVNNYSKEITVNGMVCAFCSNSLEKKFKKQKEVQSVHVDLKSKKVLVKFKDGASLADEKLKKLISSSGFNVVDIKNFKEDQ